MTTASLDNCRRLYKLSGWEATYRYLERPDSEDEPDRIRYAVTADTPAKGVAVVCPAYDLGYVLRKLQYMEDLAIHRCHHMDNSWNWEAQCHPDPDASDGYSFAYADQPEDAACKLAIALFEAGVLVKEER